MEFWSSCFVELSAELAEGPPVPSGRGPHVSSKISCYVFKNFLYFFFKYSKCKMRKHVESLPKMDKFINFH